MSVLLFRPRALDRDQRVVDDDQLLRRHIVQKRIVKRFDLRVQHGQKLFAVICVLPQLPQILPDIGRAQIDMLRRNKLAACKQCQLNGASTYIHHDRTVLDTFAKILHRAERLVEQKPLARIVQYLHIHPAYDPCLVDEGLDVVCRQQRVARVDIVGICPVCGDRLFHLCKRVDHHQKLFLGQLVLQQDVAGEIHAPPQLIDLPDPFPLCDLKHLQADAIGAYMYGSVDCHTVFLHIRINPYIVRLYA